MKFEIGEIYSNDDISITFSVGNAGGMRYSNNGVTCHLFEKKDVNKYQYAGLVELDYGKTIKEVSEKDDEGCNRTVYKFPLKKLLRSISK